MTYSFACDCGGHCQVEMSSKLIIGHKEVCGDCGGVMRRDYRREGAAIAMSSCEKNVFPYKDVTLGRTIYSQADRKKEMKKQGLIDNPVTDTTRARMRDMKRRTSVVVPTKATKVKGGE